MKKLQQEIAYFNKKRNWQSYHTPKNLAIALSVEAAELLEIYQWLTPEQSEDVPPQTLAHIEEEVADILIYLLTLAARHNIDPLTAARNKMKKNALKYPEPENAPTSSADRFSGKI